MNNQIVINHQYAFKLKNDLFYEPKKQDRFNNSVGNE